MLSKQLQGEFAAREDAAKELGSVTERLQGSWHLQEDERAMLLRKQEQLTRMLDQHSTQVSLLPSTSANSTIHARGYVQQNAQHRPLSKWGTFAGDKSSKEASNAFYIDCARLSYNKFVYDWWFTGRCSYCDTHAAPKT